MRQVLLALALRDESLGGAEAAELADRALELARGDRALDPRRRLPPRAGSNRKRSRSAFAPTVTVPGVQWS